MSPDDLDRLARDLAPLVRAAAKRWPHADYGDDGQRLVMLALPGGPPPGVRLYTEPETRRFGRIFIPDVDDRPDPADLDLKRPVQDMTDAYMHGVPSCETTTRSG